MANLKTNYKDQLLDTSVNTERKFNLVDQDGNVIASGVSLRDITQYSQTGDTFGAADINKITEKINEQNNSLSDKTSYPNMTNQRTIIQNNGEYTIDENGYIGVYFNTSTGSVRVNGRGVYYIGSTTMEATFMGFPVKMGDIIKAEGFNPSKTSEVFFIPNR